MTQHHANLAQADVDPSHPAADATATYFRAAVATIDAEFGEGYARENPQLVASLVQATAIEAAVGSGRAAHVETLTLVERLSREMNETLLSLKPRLFG